MRLLTIAATSGILFFGCHKQGPPPMMERPPTPVTVVTAREQDVPVYLDEIGKCVARESVEIQPQVSGRITKIHFTDGADLKTSDPLFTIDPRPYQAQLAAAEASVAQMKANLELSKLEFARMANLVKTNATAQQDYDTKKNAIEVAAAQLKSSEAAVDTARLNLEYCFILSPIEGRAGKRLVDIGNVVTPVANANTPLLVIERLNPIYAEFTVTESELSAVQQNMTSGTLKVEVRLPDEPNNPRTGDLTFVDNAVQEGTGTVKVRATLANADHHFWPGRFVKVRLILATIPNAVLIPADAPQMSAKGTFVYVVKDDSTAELRLVKTGQRQGDLVVITTGLKAGERLVTAGQLTLVPGGKVRVVEAMTTGTAQLNGGTSSPQAGSVK